MNKRWIRLTFFAFLGVAFTLGSFAAQAAPAEAGRVTKDEFFIISSLNLQKHTMVLKLPTEVTIQMSVTAKTDVVDEHGRHLQISDLRSGETVYVTYARNGDSLEALRIRLGPMTRQELLRRYLNEDAAVRKGQGRTIVSPQGPGA